MAKRRLKIKDFTKFIRNATSLARALYDLTKVLLDNFGE